MNKYQWLAVPSALGIAITGLVTLPSEALAASISRIPGNFAGAVPSTPSGWTDLGWVTRGRASAPGDWEFGVTTQDNSSGVVQQTNWDWTNGENVGWDLLWNSDENEMTFTIGGQTLVLDQEGPASGTFNGFSLFTTSRTAENKVDEGTEIFLQVNEVNGMATGPEVTSSATSPEAGGPIISSQFFYESDEAITSVSGIARMSWLDGGLNPQDSRARDRVAFKIAGFSNGKSDETPDSIPEPGTLFGLMMLGGLAITGRKTLNGRNSH